MQRKWLMLAAGAMLSTLIVGCSENHGELGNRNIRQQSIREDGNGNMILKQRFADDQMNDRNRMNGRRLNSNNIIGSHRNYQLEMSPKLSDQLSALSGVGQAYVMLTDNNAYVAITAKEAGTGLQAHAAGHSIRPLSRTDMAYLPPGSHIAARSMKDTMSRDNYERMQAASRHLDAKGRFDSTKSYDSTKVGRVKAKSLPGTHDTFTEQQNVGRFNYNMKMQSNKFYDKGNTITPLAAGENRWSTNGYRNSREYDMYGNGYQSVQPYSALGLGHANPNALTNELKDRIAAEVKNAVPNIDHVYVSTNADFVHRMTAYMEDVRLGHPIQAYIAEFNAMVERIFPPQPARRP